MPSSVIIAIAYSVVSAAAGGVLVAAGVAAATAAVVGSIIGAVAAAGVASLISPSYDQPDAMAALVQGRTITGRAAIAPWVIIYGQTRVGGTITYLQATEKNKYLHIIITLSGHVLEEITTVYFDNDALTIDTGNNNNVTNPARFNNRAQVYGALGDEPAQAFPGLVAASNGLWTNAHLQQGMGKLYVRLQFDPDVYPNGVPNITAVVKGRKVYDPRSGLTAWSDNAALCLNDYLVNKDFGVGADYAEEVNETALITAANVCDESVNLIQGGTEKRYTFNGTFETDGTSPEGLLPIFLTAMAGRSTYIAGKWIIYAGAYLAPTVTITESDIRGPIKTFTRASKRDLFNRVRGVYVEPMNLYQPTDFPIVKNDFYTVQDNNEKLWLNMDLPFTQSGATAQRIGKLELERSRQAIVVVLPLKLSMYRLQPGDTFMLTLPRYGWASKVFEIQEMGFASQGETLGVDVVAKETAAAVYDWNMGEETVIDPAPDTDLPDPFAVGTPGVVTVVESLYVSLQSAGPKVKVIASWAASDDWFSISGLSTYQLEYKAIADAAFISVANIKATTYTFLDFPPGFYQFRVKAINIRGVSGAYSPLTQINILGLLAPPQNVQNFAVHPASGLAQFSWDLHPDLDVRLGGKIEVRHTDSTSTFKWPDSALIARYDGLSTSAVGPLIEGTYLAKARDTAGVYSSSFSAFGLTEADITGFVTIATIQEQPTFTGTKINLQIVSQRLEITDTALFAGTYYFPGSITGRPGYIDLGSKHPRRFESDLQMQRYDTGDLIDSRGLVDTWPTVDGGDVDVGDSALYVRTTDGDPSGGGWGQWTPFRVAELNVRGAQFKVEYLVEQVTHNISLSNLRVDIKVNSR